MSVGRDKHFHLSAANPSPKSTSIAFAWAGLPPYGLNAIRAVIVRRGVQPIVIGTRPDTSYDAIEKVASLPIHWIDPDDTSIDWSQFSKAIPEVLVVSGWATPAFNVLGSQVRRNGGSVIVMIDNRWRGDLRQWLAPIVFQTKYRNWFRGAIVPGKSARSFARYLGLPDAAIHEGLYGGNPAIFEPGPPLSERPNRLIFVGRFDARKGIRELAAAWSMVAGQLPEWELHAVGEGPLSALLADLPRVTLHPFQQPAELARIYRDARFLVLPSLEDHWGLVVHEAARSGCGLIVSDHVGARADLANSVNSFSFAPGNARALADAILSATQRGERELRATYHESLALAYRFGPTAFANAVETAIERIHSGA